MLTTLFEMYLDYKIRNKKSIFGYNIISMTETPHKKNYKFGSKIDKSEHKTINIVLQK